MLHGVMDQGIEMEWVPLRSRTNRKLLKDLLSLADKYLTFISLDDALSIMEGEKRPVNNACVVTFDDGQLNNVTCALPILRELSIPCTFYPTTKVLDDQSSYWFDRLDFAIQQSGLHGLTIEGSGIKVVIDQTSKDSLSKTLSTLVGLLKNKHKSDTDFQNHVSEICEYLESKSGRSISQLKEPDYWSAPMTWDDVIQCSKSNDVIIGSHTVNHVRLSIADTATVLSELNESKSAIEEKTAVYCDHFCYPNGDWNNETTAMVRKAGYKTAVLTDTGFNRVCSDKYKLKRISFPYNCTVIMGLFVITGVLSAYTNLKKYFVDFHKKKTAT